MRAAVNDRYGPADVVRIAEVPTPTPKESEVLVRVRAAAVTSGDARIRAARYPKGFAPFARPVFGLLKPRRRVLGSAFSGVVEAVGSRVTGIAVGGEVAGMAGMRMGVHAEYAAVEAKRVVPKPAGVSHEDAAGVLFGGTTALHYLRDKGGLTAGKSVLVNGASGAVGTSAVQLAKHLGGVVTGVTSTANVELVKGLGADRVIDYRTTALAQVTDRYDVVLDTVGNLPPSSGRRLLTEGGVLLLVVATLGETLRARGNVKAGPATERPEDFALLLDLVASGTLRVVVEAMPLDEIVEAYQRIDSGHKVGNLVVRP